MIEGKFITTPQAHIKLGQLCKDEYGNPALSIKRGKKDEYEAVSIDYLVSTLSKAKDRMEEEYDI